VLVRTDEVDATAGLPGVLDDELERLAFGDDAQIDVEDLAVVAEGQLHPSAFGRPDVELDRVEAKAVLAGDQR